MSKSTHTPHRSFSDSLLTDLFPSCPGKHCLGLRGVIVSETKSPRHLAPGGKHMKLEDRNDD